MNRRSLFSSLAGVLGIGFIPRVAKAQTSNTFGQISLEGLSDIMRLPIGVRITGLRMTEDGMAEFDFTGPSLPSGQVSLHYHKSVETRILEDGSKVLVVSYTNSSHKGNFSFYRQGSKR